MAASAPDKDTASIFRATRIGFMQGRFSEVPPGVIQCFPWESWQSEFSLARTHGFGLMEWTLDQERLYENPFMTAAGQTEITQLSARMGLQILSVTGDCFMQAPFWKASEERCDTLRGDLRAIIQACGALEVTFLVVPLVDQGAIETPDQEAKLVEMLLENADFLRQNKLVIAFECDYPPDQLREFIAKFPKDCFGINYDTGNSAALGYQPDEEIAAYGQRIVNVHIKDRKLGGATVPLGEGCADFGAIMSSLAALHYKGNFILQTARDPFGRHAEILVSYKNLVEDWIKHYEF